MDVTSVTIKYTNLAHPIHKQLPTHPAPLQPKDHKTKKINLVGQVFFFSQSIEHSHCAHLKSNTFQSHQTHIA